MNKFSNYKSRKGASLVDVIIGVSLIALAAGSFTTVILNIRENSNNAYSMIRATWMANAVLEIISGYPFEDSDGIEGHLGRDGGERYDKEDFDDVDDFNGYTYGLAEYADITAIISVSFVNVDGDPHPVISPSGSATNFKLIQVTVSAPDLTSTLLLQTLKSRAG